jgi:hypothetical protein
MLFGHMHSSLREGGRRQMVGISHKTVCVNTAEVPRWREVGGVRQHQFTVCDLSGAARPELQEVRSVWVAPPTDSSHGEDEVTYRIVDDEPLYRIGGHVLDTNTGEWNVVEV